MASQPQITLAQLAYRADAGGYPDNTEITWPIQVTVKKGWGVKNDAEKGPSQSATITDASGGEVALYWYGRKGEILQPFQDRDQIEITQTGSKVPVLGSLGPTSKNQGARKITVYGPGAVRNLTRPAGNGAGNAMAGVGLPPLPGQAAAPAGPGVHNFAQPPAGPPVTFSQPASQPAREPMSEGDAVRLLGRVYRDLASEVYGVPFGSSATYLEHVEREGEALAIMAVGVLSAVASGLVKAEEVDDEIGF